MTNVPLVYLPGVCKVDSDYINSIKSGGVNNHPATGRFIDMNKTRFVAGQPERILGAAFLTTTALTGVARGIRDWRDNSQVIYLAAGTNSKLYVYSQNMLTDITPYRALITSSLNNPFTTISGSPIVNVIQAGHSLVAGDYIVFTSSAAVAGLTISGVYFVTAVVDANNYTITASSPANASTTGGGTVTYTIYRVSLTNPFTTTSGSATVTVTHANSGAAVGDYVIFTGASAVGGLTISGEYQIKTFSTSTYTITASSTASSSATGGGTVTVQYDISTGNVNTLSAFGYGTGGYGQDPGTGYGTTGNSSIVLNARIWALAHYGQQMLCNPSGGTIYVWDPVIRGRAYPLYNAPTVVNWMFVTPERFVMAQGTNTNPTQVSWPDQNDYTNWTPSATNTANAGRTLQEGSYVVGGITVRDGINMQFTNTAAYTFTYSGDNAIYDTQTAGIGCGLVGPLAVAVMGGTAYWFSGQDFWMWNGSVQQMPSDDIRDYVVKDLDTSQQVKCVCGTNIAKKEVWFLYPSLTDATSENSRYVIYHVDQGCWSSGTYNRTSWIDRNLFPNPIATDNVSNLGLTSNIYSMDSTSPNNNDADDVYITMSPMDISKGDKIMDVMSFSPDFQRLSSNSPSLLGLNLTINTQNYSGDPIVAVGPYPLNTDDSTNRVDLRVGARLVGWKLEATGIMTDYRLGLPTLEVEPAGQRR